MTGDIEGNLETRTTSGQTTTYVWDTSNRLVSATAGGTEIFSAAYDYRTRRVLKTEGGASTYFVYDGGISVQERPSGSLPGNVDVEYVYGGSLGAGIGGILYEDRGGTKTYSSYNQVGHTMAQTDGTGAVTAWNIYEAFGERSSFWPATTAGNRLANTRELDGALGFYNHGFRYYDPGIGRYASLDPLGYAAGYNRYAYTLNDPVTGVDPTGLDRVEVGFNSEKDSYDVFFVNEGFVFDSRPQLIGTLVNRGGHFWVKLAGGLANDKFYTMGEIREESDSWTTNWAHFSKNDRYGHTGSQIDDSFSQGVGFAPRGDFESLSSGVLTPSSVDARRGVLGVTEALAKIGAANYMTPAAAANAFHKATLVGELVGQLAMADNGGEVVQELAAGIAPVGVGRAVRAIAARGGTRTVIGRTTDLQKLPAGERSLIDRLPDQGSPRANWRQNSGVLRAEMRRGQPIRDASPGDTGGRFLNAERALLRDRGWTFDSSTSLWMPPGG